MCACVCVALLFVHIGVLNIVSLALHVTQLCMYLYVNVCYASRFGYSDSFPMIDRVCTQIHTHKCL